MKITSSRKLGLVEDHILKAIIEEKQDVFVLYIGHLCDSSEEFKEFINNKHPTDKVIFISPSMMKEIMTLNACFQYNEHNDFHFYCPFCSAQTMPDPQVCDNTAIPY